VKQLGLKYWPDDRWLPGLQVTLGIRICGALVPNHVDGLIEFACRPFGKVSSLEPDKLPGHWEFRFPLMFG
jgi:hypothetical protein